MVKLKSLRTRAGLSAEVVAAKLGVTVEELLKLERGRSPVPLAVARDVAVLLNASVTEVMGQQLEVTDWKECPHSIMDVGEDWGGVTIKIAGQELEYPISSDERDRLLLHMQSLDIQTDRDRSARILIETMNDRWVLVNMVHVRTLELRHDDDKATPYYAHPEVYRSISANEHRNGELGPLLTAEIGKHFEIIGEEAADSSSSQMRLIWSDGTIEDDMFLSDGWVVNALFQIELALDDPPPFPFAMLDSEGGYVSGYYNLDQIAVLEVPLEEFRRLSAPEE